MRNIIRGKEVRKRTGLGATTIWRLMGNGEFPQSIRLTEAGAIGWYEDEIDAWIHDRVRAAGKYKVKRSPEKDRAEAEPSPQPAE